MAKNKHITDLSNEEALWLHSMLAASHPAVKTARAEVAEGTSTPVAFNLSCEGNLNRGEGYDHPVWQSADWVGGFANLLDTLKKVDHFLANGDVDGARELVGDLTVNKVAKLVTATDNKVSKALKAEVTAEIEATMDSTVKRFAGPVTSNGTVAKS